MFKSKMAVLLGALAVSSVALADLSTGLVAHYSFDDCSAKDVSGHGNDGIIKNNVTCTNGVISKALHLQGEGYTTDTGGHILLPHIDFMSMSKYSICLWANEEGMSSSDGESYISFGSDPGITGIGAIGIGHYWLNGSNKIEFYNGGGQSIKTPFLSKYKNTFVHYCLSYTNDTLKAYKNGAFLGSLKSQTSTVGTNASMGRHWWWYGGTTTSTRFIGSLDEVRIYNRALPATDVSALYQLTKPVGGLLQGFNSYTAICANTTTGKEVTISASVNPVLDCEKAGLVVNPKDNVTLTIEGGAH